MALELLRILDSQGQVSVDCSTLFQIGERKRRNAHPCVSRSAIVRFLVDVAFIETVIPENEVLLQRNVWT